MKIIHYAFGVHIDSDEELIVYGCNWAVKAKADKVTKQKKNVTCKNCLKIIEGNGKLIKIK